MKGRMMRKRFAAVPAYLCELLGTALVMFHGLGWACWLFGVGAPILVWVPNTALRLCFEAVCFGAGALVVVYSPLGQRSGGHLNPSVTLGFWLLNKISTRDALAYIFMQILGALVGAGLVLGLWPRLARSIRLGATSLGPGVPLVLGFGLEAGMTFLLMLTILVLVNSRRMRWAAVMAELLIILLTINFSGFTGPSLNPARSLAPAVLIMFWQNQWIYWLGPPLGAVLATLLYRQGIIGTGKSYCSKLYHTSAFPCHHARCGYSNSADIDDFSRS